ncbi:MAG: hypothetical protein E7328_04190 [Clostridiales bacterium]|nr:hypothetical protein [Clostridiales bacterium]
MYDLLLINAAVITVDAKHTQYANGFVAVTGDTISAIGPMEQLPDPLPESKRVLDLTGHAVLPGLVDGHGHAGHCLLKTLGEHLDDEWDILAETVYYSATDEEFWYAEGALAAAERLKFGTTTAVSMVGSTPRIDIIEPVGASLKAGSDVGIRQLSGIGSANGPWPKKARLFHKDGSVDHYDVAPDIALKTTEAALKAYTGKFERATCIVAPGKMGFRPDQSAEDNITHNKTMYRLSREYDVPLHTHAYGGDVQFLFDTTPEVLSPRMSLTHSTGYSHRELEILRDTGTYVFHGPTTNGHIKGHCPGYQMLKMGINLAVITDGTAPDRSFDLWRDMKNFLLLQRFMERDQKLLSAGKALELVTIEPAKALGMDHLVGSLEVGKKADIIAVDMMQPHLAPYGVMPLQRLVFHAMGQDVTHTIVDGIIMMEDRKLTQADESAIIKNATDAFTTMFSRLGRPDIIENEKLYSLYQG